jgi:hypothetical protein
MEERERNQSRERRKKKLEVPGGGKTWKWPEVQRVSAAGTVRHGATPLEMR